MKLLVALCLAALPAVAVQAHHDHHDIHVRSLRCGWLEGDDVRDIRNLSDFCGRSVPASLKIATATATRERLWLEAPADVVAALRVDDRTATRALLADWLRQWKRVSGYPSASLVLMYRHVEIGRAQTMVGGDTVIVR
jgi:hypothetical protein